MVDENKQDLVAFDNGYSGDSFKAALKRVVSTVIDRMSKCCGPVSKFSVQLNPVATSTYTKDGINTLRSWHPTNPTDQALLNEFIYIGDTVERQVGDGTTTAMLLCAEFLGQHLAGKYITTSTKIPNIPLDELGYRYVLNCWNKLVARLEHYMTPFTITVDRLMDELKYTREDAIKLMAELQANCSSHSDKNVTDTICKLFSLLPVEAWPYLSFRTAQMETNKPLSLELGFNPEEMPGSTSRFALGVRVMYKPSDFDAGDTYYGKDESHFIGCIAPINANAPNAEALTQEVDRLIGADPDGIITIVMPMPIDPISRNFMVNLVNERKPYPIVVAYHCPENNDDVRNEIGVAMTLADKRMPVDIGTPINIGKFKMRISGDSLMIYDLYDNPDHDQIIPMAKDPNSAISKYIEYIDHQINRLKTGKNFDPALKERILRHYNELYLKAKYAYVPQLIIGGAVHDITAQIDVVTDCIKATRSALTYGFHPGSNIALLIAAWKVKKELAESDCARSVNCLRWDDTQEILCGMLSNSIVACIDALTKNVAYRDSGRYSYDVALNEIEKNTIDDVNDVPFLWFDTDKAGFDFFKITFDRALTENIPVPIQSTKLTKALLDRLGEVILRLIFTESAVEVHL